MSGSRANGIPVRPTPAARVSPCLEIPVDSPHGTAQPQHKVVALCGNPRPGSRTSTVARTVAAAIASLVDAPEPGMIELSSLAGDLFAPEHPQVDAALAEAAAASVLVVATPTFKAAYSGLLKAFLDLYRSPAFEGVTAVPVQVAADPAHLLAADVHLRPLLVELGASVPTRAFVVAEAELERLEERVGSWTAAAAGHFQRFTESRAR